MQYFDLYIDGIKDLFTYSDRNNEFKVGDSVIVPFRNSKKSAIIIRKNLNENFDFKVLNISSLMKNSITLNKEQLKLIQWIHGYYLASYDSIIKTIIPKNIKIKYRQNYFLNLNSINENNENQENIDNFLKNPIIDFILNLGLVSYSTAIQKFKTATIKSLIEDKYLILFEKNIKINIEQFNKLYLVNKEVYEYFLKKIYIKKEKLEKHFNKKDINYLLERKILSIEIKLSDKKNFLNENLKIIRQSESILTKEQSKIKEEIEKYEKSFFLLKGVTGSGKTEVYIELIKEAFFRGEGSIFLVPEISLTPQMINKFKNEFKNNIAILHSRLTDNERAKEWESLYKGEKQIVLGVRSAVFSPVKNLKYIILDEEHETTYKQDSSPRYNAKYVAIKRCMIEDSKLILGSATPSIESYYYARNNIYQLLTMNNRFGTAQMPSVEIVDMKQEKDLFFSKKLLKSIKETLIKKEQVILLLNRKGYSTYIQCKECGHVEECEHCSIKMSYFNGKDILKCNYCGKTKKYTGTCSKCGSKNLVHSGKGIERVEEELKKYFDVPIVKADGDYSRDKEFFSNLYNDFLEKKYSILIGTQIVAKGLHFPEVTLVGVINADIILNFPDFRAGEKTYQLLTQVSGRAGRGIKNGKVIIQTYQPENYVLKNSKEENYDIFYKEEIESRRIFSYPPFSKIINIGISSRNEEKLQKEVKKISNLIKADNVDIYGPMPSMVYKVKNRYRMNIFVKGDKKNIDIYKKYLKNRLKTYVNNDVRVVLDVDPINLF